MPPTIPIVVELSAEMASRELALPAGGWHSPPHLAAVTATLQDLYPAWPGLRLTAKRKVDRNKKDANGQGQGVVAWDVEVTNQLGELVASYDILTLVLKRA